MYWQRQAIFDSKGSKLPSSGATRIPTFLWCDQDSNLPLVRPGFQLSSPVTRIPTFLWCDQDSNLPLVRPGFQPSSGATRIPTFRWCDQDSNLPLARPGGDPTKVDPNVATFAWNASRMSDRANVPPTYGTGFVSRGSEHSLWRHHGHENKKLKSAQLTSCFCDHDDVTESARTHVIQNPKAKYRVVYWYHCYDAGC